MIIQPKIRGFICTTAHPEGCARAVQDQIDWVKAQAPFDGPTKVLVIGSSTGYGLASRIAASFGAGASTLGVFFERPADKKRTASAGWYNTVGFENAARAAGHYARSINGDAFSDEIKAQTIAAIKEDLQQVDLVVYSLASPRRTHPKTGESFSSVLKPIGDSYSSKTVNVQTGEVSDISIETASEEEIAHTTAVMGGEDWELWMSALDDAGVLAKGARSVAFSYIGTEITWPIYWHGALGKAKEDLDRAAAAIDAKLQESGGGANVAVLKSVVTQASAAIPVMPLYIAMVYNVMKEKGLHEGTIEQLNRLFGERLYGGEFTTDEAGRLRLDDWELRDDVQQACKDLWPQVTTENLFQITDYAGYKHEFLKLFGFERDDVDYDADVNPEVEFDVVTL